MAVAAYPKTGGGQLVPAGEVAPVDRTDQREVLAVGGSAGIMDVKMAVGTSLADGEAGSHSGLEEEEEEAEAAVEDMEEEVVVVGAEEEAAEGQNPRY